MTTPRWIPGGGATSPLGFRAGAAAAGVKTYGPEPRLDVGILCSDPPANVAGVFTQNRIVGAPVELCRERALGGRGSGVVVNSGCSNVAMGQAGRKNAARMAELAEAHLGVSAGSMFVASTGVIGRPLPMDRIERGIAACQVSREGGAEFARAMLTTDTFPKQHAMSITVDGVTFTVGGVAKGSGMVHPDMATVLCFLTADFGADPGWLRSALRAVADVSLNMVDVDMDTSTSDTMLLFANGAAGGPQLGAGHPAEATVIAALEAVAIALARDLARDGEGARTLIEAEVTGATTLRDARLAARTIVSSPLVKTMVTGRDPNLGRVMMAVGRSGAAVDVERTSVWIGAEPAFERGRPTAAPYSEIAKAMDAPEVKIRVDLGLGTERAVAWGCDLTEGYIRINADYTT